MWACTFKDKKVVINAQYFDGNGYNSFLDDVELVKMVMF